MTSAKSTRGKSSTLRGFASTSSVTWQETPTSRTLSAPRRSDERPAGWLKDNHILHNSDGIGCNTVPGCLSTSDRIEPPTDSCMRMSRSKGSRQGSRLLLWSACNECTFQERKRAHYDKARVRAWYGGNVRGGVFRGVAPGASSSCSPVPNAAADGAPMVVWMSFRRVMPTAPRCPRFCGNRFISSRGFRQLRRSDRTSRWSCPRVLSVHAESSAA